MKVDLSSISGVEIVCGNPEHCIRLLQLLHQVSDMMGDEEDGDEDEDRSPDMDDDDIIKAE